jgi:predicted MFS family arabinose efflux permease
VSAGWMRQCAADARAKGKGDAVEEGRRDGKADGAQNAPELLHRCWRLCTHKAVRSLMAVKLLAALARELLFVTLPLVLSGEMQLSVAESGYIVSYIGLISFFGVISAPRHALQSLHQSTGCLCEGCGQVIVYACSAWQVSTACPAVHGFLIGWLTKRFSDDTIVRSACLGLLVTFAALIFCTSFWQLAALMLPFSVCSFTFTTVNTAQLSKAVPQQHTGSVLALDMSLESVSSLVSPMLGTALLQRQGLRGIGSTGALLMVAVVLLMQFSSAEAQECEAKRA